jgi:hypothetical protein
MKKGRIGPNVCHLCLQGEEIAHHIFIHCDFTRTVLNYISSALKTNLSWDGPSLAICLENLTKAAPLYITLPPLIYWNIWTERNCYIFQNKSPSAHSVAYKTLGLHYSWTSIHAVKQKEKPIHLPHNLDSTPTGWFDGASQQNNLQSGAGGLIHISHNTICRWTFNCGQGTNTRA